MWFDMVFHIWSLFLVLKKLLCVLVLCVGLHHVQLQLVLHFLITWAMAFPICRKITKISKYMERGMLSGAVPSQGTVAFHTFYQFFETVLSVAWDSINQSIKFVFHFSKSSHTSLLKPGLTFWNCSRKPYFCTPASNFACKQIPKWFARLSHDSRLTPFHPSVLFLETQYICCYNLHTMKTYT